MTTLDDVARMLAAALRECWPSISKPLNEWEAANERRAAALASFDQLGGNETSGTR